jgi:hypothetical protein
MNRRLNTALSMASANQTEILATPTRTTNVIRPSAWGTSSATRVASPADDLIASAEAFAKRAHEILLAHRSRYGTYRGDLDAARLEILSEARRVPRTWRVVE